VYDADDEKAKAYVKQRLEEEDNEVVNPYF
jgi:hypothetical protein